MDIEADICKDVMMRCADLIANTRNGMEPDALDTVDAHRMTSRLRLANGAESTRGILEARTPMLDREKVIKGLECCQHAYPKDCERCAYNDPDCDMVECTSALTSDALALLLDQEQKIKEQEQTYSALLKEVESLKCAIRSNIVLRLNDLDRRRVNLLNEIVSNRDM